MASAVAIGDDGESAEFAEVLSESMVIEDLLPLYFTLCTDEQDSVPTRPR